MSICNTFRHPIDPKCDIIIIVDHMVSVAKLFIIPWPMKVKISDVTLLVQENYYSFKKKNWIYFLMYSIVPGHQ